MSNHLVFCVHGMGEQDAGWADAGIDVLRRAWSDYERLADVDFDDAFEVVPLLYSPIFSDTRARANADFAAFRATLLGDLPAGDRVRPATLEKQLDRIEEYLGTGDDSFPWTHLLDVVLYRFSNTLRMGVDVEIARQLVGTLADRPHRSWSILAHSLGTSVSHNVLASLYNTGFPDAEGGPLAPLSPLTTRCHTLAMIANVSRVLQRDGSKVYESAVRPGAGTGERLCAWYLNARHRLDPFVAVKPFDPESWPDPGTYAMDRYQAIRPAHICFEAGELPRVHDFDHYLLNPRVHVPLFRSICGSRLVGEHEFQEARARFDGEILSDSIDRVRELLERQLPAAGGDWKQLLTAMRRLFK